MCTKEKKVTVNCFYATPIDTIYVLLAINFPFANFHRGKQTKRVQCVTHNLNRLNFNGQIQLKSLEVT